MFNSISEKIKKYKAVIAQKIISKNYYLKAFERLEKENKHTWNWAAFLFPREWMIYRKMYLFSIIVNAIYIIILYIISPIINTFVSNEILVGSLMLVIVLSVNIFAGYFGNELYYITVKHRISNGYHLLKKYVCASVLLSICVLVTMVSLSDLLIYAFSVPLFWNTDVFVFFRFFIFLLILTFVWGGDYLQNRRELSKVKLSEDKTKINKENLSLYLEQRKQHHSFEKIFIFASCLIYLYWIHNYQFFQKDKEQAKVQETQKCELNNNLIKSER